MKAAIFAGALALVGASQASTVELNGDNFHVVKGNSAMFFQNYFTVLSQPLVVGDKVRRSDVTGNSPFAGANRVTGNVIVKIVAGSDLSKIAEEVGATVLYHFNDTAMLQFDNGTDVKAAVADLQSQSGVQAANVEVNYRLHSTQ